MTNGQMQKESDLMVNLATELGNRGKGLRSQHLTSRNPDNNEENRGSS